jgi:hypothetical protein
MYARLPFDILSEDVPQAVPAGDLLDRVDHGAALPKWRSGRRIRKLPSPLLKGAFSAVSEEVFLQGLIALKITVDAGRAETGLAVGADVARGAAHGKGPRALGQGEDYRYGAVVPCLTGKSAGKGDVDASEGDVVNRSRVHASVRAGHQCGEEGLLSRITPLVILHALWCSPFYIAVEDALDGGRKGPSVCLRQFF